MYLNAARRNAMTSPVSRYTRMLAPVSRCAGPCPDARAAIAMYFTPPRCRRPYRDAGQPPRCNKIIAGKFTFLLMCSQPLEPSSLATPCALCALHMRSMCTPCELHMAVLELRSLRPQMSHWLFLLLAKLPRCGTASDPQREA